MVLLAYTLFVYKNIKTPKPLDVLNMFLISWLKTKKFVFYVFICLMILKLSETKNMFLFS